MTAIDPERRGSAGAIHSSLQPTRIDVGMVGKGTIAVGPEGERLLPPALGELDPGTPSHDHREPSFWDRQPGGIHRSQSPTSSAPLASDRFSFPPSSHRPPPPRSPSTSTLTQLIHSKLFRNLLILLLSLFLLISALHTTQPDVLDSGMKYLADKLPQGLSRLGREEMRSLDERLRDLMGRPVLEQWEMELTNRYQVSCRGRAFSVSLPLSLSPSRSLSVPSSLSSLCSTRSHRSSLTRTQPLPPPPPHSAQCTPTPE